MADAQLVINKLADQIKSLMVTNAVLQTDLEETNKEKEDLKEQLKQIKKPKEALNETIEKGAI